MQREIILVLGKSGSGKTVWVRNEIQSKRRLFVFDIKRQFSDAGVCIYDMPSLAEYLYSNHRGRFRIIYQPEIVFDDRVDIAKEQFKDVCRGLHNVSDFYFVVDEVDRVLPESKNDRVFWDNFVNRGRHESVSIMTTTIRYTDVTRGMTSNYDRLILFRTQEPNDIRYFQTHLGDRAKDLPSLPLYHYIEKRSDEPDVHIQRPVHLA